MPLALAVRSSSQTTSVGLKSTLSSITWITFFIADISWTTGGRGGSTLEGGALGLPFLFLFLAVSEAESDLVLAGCSVFAPWSDLPTDLFVESFVDWSAGWPKAAVESPSSNASVKDIRMG